MHRIRFAVVGTSMIADDFIEVIDANPDTRYVGSMGSTPEKSRIVTEAHGGERAFSTIDELCGRNDIDAVYIATPNAIHYEQAFPLIHAGKHVLVEKPISSDTIKARELFDAARRQGVVAMEAMRPVHDPGIAKVRDLLPMIGTVRRATLRYGKYSSRYDELLAGRHTNIFDAKLATGALMDLGVYCVETMVALFGKPDGISCSSVLVSEGREELTGGTIDGAGNIIAHYGSSIVNLAYSKVTQDLLPCQIEGESGTIMFDKVDGPTSGEIHLRGTAVRNAAKSTARSLGDREEPIDFTAHENNMRFELDDFVACIKGKQDPSVFEAISQTSLQIMDEARRQCGLRFPMDS